MAISKSQMQFFMIKIKCVTVNHKRSTAVIQRCSVSLYIIISRCKGACLFGTGPGKKSHHHYPFIFFSENEMRSANLYVHYSPLLETFWINQLFIL